MIQAAYALMNCDEIAKQSSSGGAFISIAVSFFERFGNDGDAVVYAVEYDQNNRCTKYSFATTLEECHKFQGSKYIKSRIGECSAEIKNAIKSGKTVLVVGLPCQIYALKRYLEKNTVPTDNLYTVDIMCHGTPEDKYWNEYVHWLEGKYGSKLRDYSFRYKQAKWKNYPARARFANGRIIVNSQEVRLFNELFLKGFLMQEHCYRCQFANKNREGDITLADFWGINRILPEFKYKSGASLVLINGEKGMVLLEGIDDRHTEMMRCSNDGYQDYQHNLKKPTQKPNSLIEFKNDYDNYGFEFCAKKYAEYNTIGKIKFKVKKILNEVGLVDFIRKR